MKHPPDHLSPHLESESPERLTERQRERLCELDEGGASIMRNFIPQLERGLDTLPPGHAAEQSDFLSQIVASADGTGTQRERLRRTTHILDEDELDLALIEKKVGRRAAYVKESTPELSTGERRKDQNGSAGNGRTLAETRIMEHRLVRNHGETILRLIEVFDEAAERQRSSAA